MAHRIPLAAPLVLFVLTLLVTPGCGERPGNGGPEPLPADLLAEIIRCEDRRTADLELLRELVGHRMAEVRSRAALALGRIGDHRTVPLIAEVMGDRNPAVRGDAAFAAGLSGLPDVCDPLKELLTDGDPHVRGMAIQALLRLGPVDGGAGTLARDLIAAAGTAPGPSLESLLGNAWRLEGDHGVVGLLMGWAAKPADSGGEQRSAAIYSLARRGEVAAAPLFISLLADGDPLVRALAAKGLGTAGANGADPEAIGPALCAMLETDDDWLVRVEGFNALGRLGIAPDKEVLCRAMADEHPQVQTAAIRAAGQMEEVGEQAREWLATLLGAAEAGVAPDAAEALARLGDERGLAWALERSRDEVPLRRADAAPALARFPADDRARTALRAMLGDEAAPVVRAALTAVANTGQAAEYREDIVRQLIDGGHPLTRAAAAEALGAIEDRASVLPLLLAADPRESRQKAADCRLSVLGLLADFQENADALAAVTGALESKDRLVRQRAAEVLRGWGLGDRVPDGACEARGRVAAERYHRAAALCSHTVTAFIDTAHGTVTLELLPREAPLNVLNFVDLAGEGYFEGIRFHRVVPGFVVQGGDPEGDGWGGPGYSVRCENSRLAYERGMVGMALSGKDTGGSQFFFTLAPQPHLDGRYTIFARVTKGMEVVDRIRRGERIGTVRVAVDPS